MKVGVVGLGEVAQVIHLPILQDHSDKFEIAAICDISQELLGALGEPYPVPAAPRYTDYANLAGQRDLDAVFVLNSDEYHTDPALAAIQHGKHVLIEKPMCLTRQEAEPFINPPNQAGVQAMLAYRLRITTAFARPP